jgi:uncharacterized protein YjbI with pentapeptide repeats
MADICEIADQPIESSSRSRTPTARWVEKAAGHAILTYGFLFLLLLFHNQASGAVTRETIRQGILAGDQISFNASAPESARTIDADWIDEAVMRHAPIQISHAVIQGRLELRDSNIDQPFYMWDCTFKDYADFSYATFKREFFVSDGTFLGGVSFQSAVFDQKAMFQRTSFEGGAATFTETHFYSDFDAEGAKFGTRGGGGTSFIHARFDGTADFAISVFNAGVDFISTQFFGQGYFPGARFHSSADFSRARFFDIATFGANAPSKFDATFEGTAYFMETQFHSTAYFKGVPFDNETDFVGARFDGDAHFEAGMFRGPVSFRSAVFHTVYFSTTATEETPQFGSSVDLLGCTYDRIEVNVPSLLRYPNGQSRIHPYNRQPYVQLEEALRKSGFEKSADYVYAERRSVENGNGFRSIWNRLYWLVANYGIDLWHEFIGSLGFILIGMWVFSRPHAVTIGESETRTTISPWSALFIAVRHFLPFPLPAKSRWNPSHHLLCKWPTWSFLTAASYANLLQVFGWILIPLAAAWLTGALRHTAQ